MVVFSLVTKVRSLVAALVATASILGANPAMANASANADIIAPLREAQAQKGQAATATSDEEFRSLFAQWQSIDGTKKTVNIALPKGTAMVPGLTAFVPPSSISIPSRSPLTAMIMTSGYGMRYHPVLGGRRQHKGVDLAAPTGTPVYAPADGVVSRADWFSSYGLYISLEHGGKIETRYGHLSRLNVFAGQKVKKGDLIGYVGTTGRSTGPHLHYEVRIDGASVNPIPYLGSSDYKTAALKAPANAAPMGDEGE